MEKSVEDTRKGKNEVRGPSTREKKKIRQWEKPKRERKKGYLTEKGSCIGRKKKIWYKPHVFVKASASEGGGILPEEEVLQD